jgi:hypothetical protein
LSQSVEDVFSSGNLPKAAETLATMRHCLSAVGEVSYSLQKTMSCIHNLFVLLIRSFFFQVAEFANVRKQLEVLEERLDEMVQPRLVDALSNRKVSPTKE